MRWRTEPGAPVVFAVHGFSGNAWSWSAVARHLDGRVALVAIDLRGRGFSHDVDGPFGVRQHADDVSAVIRRLNASPALVAGHSMGAFVALAAAERHPDDIGGVCSSTAARRSACPTDAEPDHHLDELLGPVVTGSARCGPTGSRTAHVGRAPCIRRSHDARGGAVRAQRPPGARGRVPESGERVRRPNGRHRVAGGRRTSHDARSSIGHQDPRRRHRVGRSSPTARRRRDDRRLPQHSWRRIPDTNHYSILLGEPGAAAVADELLACLA